MLAAIWKGESMSTSGMMVGILFVYMIMTGFIGLRGRKYVKTFKDSITAGGQSSLLLLTGSAVGMQIGSGFVIGGAEYGALYGLGGAWYGLGCGLSFIAAGMIVTKFIYRHGYVSLSDYFKERYGGYSSRLIYSTVTPLSCIALFAGQLLAGKAVFYSAGLNGNMGVIITAAASFCYAAVSGYWGALVASFLQSSVIFVGMMAALFLMVSGNGVSFLQSGLPESCFSMFPYDGETFVMNTVPTIAAVFVSQGLFQRCASAKSESAAVYGNLFGGILLLPVAFVPVLLGMYGRCLYPGKNGDEVFMLLILEKLPPLAGAILLAAIICAVMSACNSIFAGVSTNIVHDIYRGMIKPDADEKECRQLMFIVNALVCIFSVVLALSMNNIIELLALSYTSISAGCLPAFVGGVFWKKGNSRGAIASAVLGIGFVLLDGLGIADLPYGSVFPLLPSAIGYVVVSLMTQNKKQG